MKIKKVRKQLKKDVSADTLYKNRELSWLTFNARVLQEADDKRNPLIERLKFLGIFSSNLDEFFRVRVASLKRMLKFKDKLTFEDDFDPQIIMDRIQDIVIRERKKFDRIYDNLIDELKAENIFIISEKDLNESQINYLNQFFHDEVLSALTPLMLESLKSFPVLKNDILYFAVLLQNSRNPKDRKYSLIELPTDILPRFIQLPKINNKHFILYLDDLIRLCLSDLYSIFNYDIITAYTIKLTRDAELDFDNDEFHNIKGALSKILKQRKEGAPVRFTYDSEMPRHFLNYFKRKLNLKNETEHLIAGGRYHNTRDFMNFPRIGGSHLIQSSIETLSHPDLIGQRSIMNVMDKKDFILHYPYQSFHYFIDLLREISIDPTVKTIKMTLYRLAKNSNIAKALINSARNGKDVSVVVELRARFDEEANIKWAEKLQEEGIKVHYGFKNYKLHAKVVYIERLLENKTKAYAVFSTGNFNEDTAKIYADDTLFTSNPELCEDARLFFNYLSVQDKEPNYKHLLPAPLKIEKELKNLIEFEINEKKAGRKAEIILKVNNFIERNIVDMIYAATKVSVPVNIIARSTCAIIPEIENLSESLHTRSLVDKFLEHSRVFYFYHGGDELLYISSADLMRRNLNHRIELATPILDKRLKEEMKRILNIQLVDNIKARELNARMDNKYIQDNDKVPVRAQEEIYYFLRNLLRNI